MPSGHGGGGRGGSHSGSYGSGGSHSGSYGGSRSSSSSSRSSYSSRRSYGGGGHYHHHYYGGGIRLSAVGAFIFLIIFTTLFGSLWSILSFSGLGELSSKMQVIESDRNYYLSLIENAKANGRIVNGEITGIYFNSEFGKWYFTYKFTTKDGYYVTNAYTYSLYEERQDPVKNGYIVEIAYDLESSDADSVPTDYVNFTLDDDGEYALYNSQYSTSVFNGITAIVLTIGIDGLLVWAIIRKRKKAKEDSDISDKTVKKVTRNKTTYTCKYCGGTYTKATDKCPNCGAKTSAITNEETEVTVIEN